jgi:7-keto-8-aminopelargonate synthetase-like enzyme
VPRHQARLRFCVISEHKKEQLDYALDTLDKLFAQKGLSKQVKA